MWLVFLLGEFEYGWRFYCGNLNMAGVSTVGISIWLAFLLWESQYGWRFYCGNLNMAGVSSVAI